MMNPPRLGARSLWAWLATIVAIAAMVLLPLQARAAGGTGNQVNSYSGLTAQQRAALYKFASDTWGFYQLDTNDPTHLPMDNITFAGGSPTPTAYGKYTSAANIGVYLWGVVAASDLGLTSRANADAQIAATLNEVQKLKRFDGFLYQWYNTDNGHVIRNPNDIDCAAEPKPTQDNCYFVSAVDNGLYASGLIVVRQALPELAPLASSLLNAMNFSIFYDNGPETACNVYYNAHNPKDPHNYQPTGQMYGGYYAYQGPAGYHNGALYSDPRIAIYIGMGMHQMPGNVWWRSWRTLPPKAPYDNCQASDPDFSWQGQWPVPGYWQDYQDPQSGQVFHVWEGHYVYRGSDLTFVPTWAGGMFEGLMDNEVVPETSWGPHSFGVNDLRWAQVQIKYTTEQLHYPVWGMSPSSTPDDTGNYGGYGVEGLKFPYNCCAPYPKPPFPLVPGGPPSQGLSQCHGCATEDVVTPHASFIALDVLPQQAYANIQTLLADYSKNRIYGRYGFFDAVNPVTGSVGHRYLVLDQSMIMAALDNALQDRAMQRHFAQDPISWAAHLYLSYETMSIVYGSRTALASSANPSAFGQPVTFTATVTPSTASETPTGTVQFSIDGRPFGSPVPLSGGRATSQPTSSLAPGSHTVTATYSGDSNFFGSSASLTQMVNASMPSSNGITVEAYGSSGCTTVTSSTKVTASGSSSGTFYFRDERPGGSPCGPYRSGVRSFKSVAIDAVTCTSHSTASIFGRAQEEIGGSTTTSTVTFRADVTMTAASGPSNGTVSVQTSDGYASGPVTAAVRISGC